jgi:hypothetical protein
LSSAVDRALADGVVRAGQIAVVDLNRQAVAAEPAGLVDSLLDSWSADGRRWKACAGCAAEAWCSIRENRRLLGEDAASSARRANVASLVRLAELGGTTVTVRELLATTALAITGGLSCSDVRKRAGRKHWQSRYLFFEAIFGAERQARDIGLLRLLTQLSLLDAGSVASRAVDDRLIADEGSSDNQSFEPVDRAQLAQSPHSTNEAQRIAAAQRRLVEHLRRRDTFEVDAGIGELGRRCGLRFVSEFLTAARGFDNPADEVGTRDGLLIGLEAVQGLRRRSLDGVFVVIDPAFRAAGTALVVARRIDLVEVHVRSLRATWCDDPDPTMGEVANFVDWLDRRVVVEFGLAEARPYRIELDLIEFEFLMRSAEGFADGGFFDATARRLRAALTRLAAGPRSGSRIDVVVGGEIRGLTIDVDGRIKSTGANI